MANEIVFDTRPFSAALERASAALVDEVRRIALEEAGALASRLKQTYPRGPTGNLRAGVTSGKNSPGRGIGAWVRSNAPHVHFIETGRPGPGRGNQHLSKAPKGKSVIFVPAAIPARQRFYGRVAALLRADVRIG